MADAYETTEQELWWADASNLTELSPVVTSLPIQSRLNTTSRPVLGQSFPAIAVTRKIYSINVPSMLTGVESEVVRTNPERSIVAIQRDANTALLMAAVVTGVPSQAQAQGEIVSNVNFQSRGTVYRCSAHLVSNANRTVTDGAPVWALIVAGSGTVTRGSTSQSGVGLKNLGQSGTTVRVPANTTAWILEGTQIV